METNTPEPARGHRIGAEWARSLTRSVNEHARLLAAHADPVAQNRRDRRGTSVAGIKPFTVRWDGERLTVYIPDGAVQLGGCTVHLVPAATGGWYVVAGASPSAGRTLSVTARVKGRVKEGPGAIHPVVTVTAANEGASVGAQAAGDIWSAGVATVTAEAGEGGAAAVSVAQGFSGTANPHPVTPGLLELYWATGDVTDTVFTPHVPGTSDAPLCGEAIGDTALPATGAATVWYIVDCSGDVPVPSVATAKSDESAHACIRIYELVDGCVSEDARAALANAVYYP